MEIQVVCSTGTGETLLSAFDTALFNAGVHNYNLIYLSSIIPPHSKIVEVEKAKEIGGIYGDRLYAVHADIRSDVEGQFIGAGIGWYQFEDGRGVFVEHTHFASTKEETESYLIRQIKESLHDLCKTRSLEYVKNDEFKFMLSLCRVGTSPTCALALALYATKNWNLYLKQVTL